MNEKEIIRLAQELAKNPQNLLDAAKSLNVGYVKLLIEAGADVNDEIFIEVVNRCRNEYGVLFINERKEEIFQLLLNAGANVNAQNGELLMITLKHGPFIDIEKVIELGADVNVRNGVSLLVAVKEMAFDLVHMLLEAGADVTLQGSNLIKAASKVEWANEEKKDKMIDLLVNELTRKKEDKEDK